MGRRDNITADTTRLDYGKSLGLQLERRRAARDVGRQNEETRQEFSHHCVVSNERRQAVPLLRHALNIIIIIIIIVIVVVVTQILPTLRPGPILTGNFYFGCRAKFREIFFHKTTCSVLQNRISKVSHFESRLVHTGNFLANETFEWNFEIKISRVTEPYEMYVPVPQLMTLHT